MSLRVNMPVTLLERLPLPCLRTYVGFSVLAFGLAFYHAHRTVTENNKMLNFDVEHSSSENIEHIVEDLPPQLTNVTLENAIDEHLKKMLSVMRFGTWSWWTLANSFYCFLIVIWKLVQKALFGELRFLEKRNLQNTFWNFAFSKFIFIFGVMKMQSLIEIVTLVRWFSLLGFLHLLTQLSKDRLEYLSHSPTASWGAHVRVLTLLVVIQLMCRDMCRDIFGMAKPKIFNIYTFKAAEILMYVLFPDTCPGQSISLMLLVMLKCLYILVRYVIQMQCTTVEMLWDRRFRYLDVANKTFKPAIFTVDFAHHLHMLIKVLKDLILPGI